MAPLAAGEKSNVTIALVAIASALIASTLVPFPLHLASAEIQFGGFVNLSEDSTESSAPQVAVSGDNVYVAWQDQSAGAADIKFRASSNAGESFSSAVLLTEGTGHAFHPRISAFEDKVYVVWGFTNEFGFSDIILRTSNDNGGTFSDPLNLSEEGDHTSGIPDILVIGENVYVTWTDGFPSDIFLRASTDGGANFGPLINLSDNEGESFGSLLSAVEDVVYVGWVDSDPGNNDIFLAVSHDSGQTFSAPVNVSHNSGDSGGAVGFPPVQLLSLGSNVYLSWHDETPGHSDVFFSASTDGGSTFGDPINVSNTTGPNAPVGDYPNITIVGSGKIYVIWSDLFSDFSTHIRLSVSTDQGETFGIPVDVAPDGFSPHVISFPDDVYAVWTNGPDGIMLRQIIDDGATFGDIIPIADPGFFSSDLDAISSQTRVFVAWKQAIEPLTAREIFFAAGVDVESPPPPEDDPQQAIADLIELSKSLGLEVGMLKQASVLLGDDNPNNDEGACGKLDAFANRVKAQSGKELTPEQADDLIMRADDIEALIGC